MHPGQAALWFADTRLDGWNGSAWVEDISAGDFHTYDRFITERDFGALKRVFLAPKAATFDPVTYPIVRTKDGVVRIVESVNGDYLDGDTPYQDAFLLLEASGQVELYSKGTTQRASGLPGSEVPSLEITTWGQVSRYSGRETEKFEDSRDSIFELTLPANTGVTEDWFMVLGDWRYEVIEVFENLLTTVTTCRRLQNG